MANVSQKIISNKALTCLGSLEIRSRCSLMLHILRSKRLTTRARALHDRIPVILHPIDYAAWLSTKITMEDLKALLESLPADLMCTTVSAGARTMRRTKGECTRRIDVG